MLMQFPPFYDVIHKLKGEQSKVILLSPQGKLFNQETAKTLAESNHLILLCGHYEGIDARVESLIDMELSIGDYVLTGGEIPAMIVADTVTRLLKGVIHEDSSEEDSLQNGLLKYPQYTKPDHYKGYAVPEVLLSGNHQMIQQWRFEEQMKQTLVKRPDLIDKIALSKEQQKLIQKIKDTIK